MQCMIDAVKLPMQFNYQYRHGLTARQMAAGRSFRRMLLSGLASQVHSFCRTTRHRPPSYNAAEG